MELKNKDIFLDDTNEFCFMTLAETQQEAAPRSSPLFVAYNCALRKF